MATININVKVNQGSANARLKQLHGQIQRVGKATEDTAKSFVNFNRTIFGATAFVGIFTQAFSSLANTLMTGSELDRAIIQFGNRFGSELPSKLQTFGDGAEAVIGPQGRFIQMIRSMTDNSIDMMAAMKSAIQLRSSGVTGDIKTLSEIVARAGTAAKIAGKDSAEGIRRVTDFLKDGSLAHLQHLGLLRLVNPELKAQLAILNNSAGVLGTAVTASYKLALGMRILRDATKGQMKGQRDLRDTLQDTAQFFDHLKRTIGTFIGKAVQPLLESFIDFSVNASYILEDIKNNKKEILFLAKAFIIGTAAVSGFVLAVGGLRLAVTALTSLIGGIPFLTVSLTALAAAVIYNKTSLKGLIEGLRTFSQIVKGSFQLIHSFISDPENFAAGIGKMDKSLHDMLKKKGLLGLVKNISRVGAIVTVFVQSTVRGFISALDSMLSKLGSVGERLKAFLGLDSGVWKRNWLETAATLGEAFGKMALSVIGLVGAFKLLKLGKGLFSGGGFLSNLLKGKDGRKPKGSKSDPMWVKMAGASITDLVAGNQDKGIGGLRGKLRGLLSQKYTKNEKEKFRYFRALGAPKAGAAKAVRSVGEAGIMRAAGIRLGAIFTSIANVGARLAVVLPTFTSWLGTAVRVLSTLGRATFIGTALAAAGTFVYGFIEGLAEAREGITKFVNAVGTWVSNLFETSPLLKSIKKGFEFLYNGIVDIFNKIREWGQSAGIEMGNMLGKVGEAMHQQNLAAWMQKVNTMKFHLGETLLPKAFYDRVDAPGPRAPVIPEMPESDIAKGVMIKQALEVVKGEDRAQMFKAFQEAISSGSASGLTITPEEWVKIFSLGLDQSKNINKLAENSDKTENNTKPSTVIKSGRAGVC